MLLIINGIDIFLFNKKIEANPENTQSFSVLCCCLLIEYSFLLFYVL